MIRVGASARSGAVCGGGLAIAWLLTGCAAGTVPHRTVDREIAAVETVRISNLPSGARVLRDAPNPADRKLLAIGAAPSLELRFTVAAREHVDNGVAKRTARATTIPLVIQAPGYMPQALSVSLPASGTRPIELAAALRPVVLSPFAVPLASAAGDEADLGLAASLSGRCAEAARHFERARASVKSPGEIEALTAAEKRCAFVSPMAAPPPAWDPATLELRGPVLESPDALMQALKASFEAEHDDAALASLRLMPSLVAAGKLSTAARLAALTAEPLAPKRAALTLRVPSALLAASRVIAARAAAASHDSRAAFALALDARGMDPFIGRSAFAKIHAARKADLAARGAAASATPVLARAYALAALALDPADGEARARLAATEAAAVDAVRLRLAVASPQDAGTRARVLELLRSKMPHHVSVVDSGEGDVTLEYLVSEPQRTHKVEKTYQSKSIVIGKVRQPNPEFEEAQNELQSAQEGMQQAEESARELQAQAQQNAAQARSMGGGWGAAMAGVAGAGQGAAAGILSDARNRLNAAQARVQRTPRFVSEAVEQQVRFPVVHLETTAVTRLLFRVDGLATTPIEVTQEATTSASADHVDAEPSIGVAAAPANVDALARLSPDVNPPLAAAVDALSLRVRDAEEASAWAAFVAWRDSGAVGDAALEGAKAAVAYLTVAGESSPKRAEVVDYLVRSLP